MGKYKVEVPYTLTFVHTFEVEAADQQEAIDKAEALAFDFDFNDTTGTGETGEGVVLESPEDRNECPDCGGELKVEVLEGAGKSLEDAKVCRECGAVFT